MLHGWEAVEASPCCNALRPELLAAPRANNQIGFSRDYLLGRHYAILGGALIPTFGEDVDATGDFDEFRNPSNSGDQRIVPFLKEHPRAFR